MPWPQLYCPFESGLNPHADRVSEETHAWAEAMRLVTNASKSRQLAAEKYSRLASRFFPHASYEAVRLFSDWTAWLFWHDDVCDETELGQDPSRLSLEFQQFSRLLAGQSEVRGDHAFDHAVVDMRDRFVALSPDPTWMLRFVASATEYFEACVWEADNRAHNRAPDVATFIALRRCTGGMWMYLDFIELANGMTLPMPLRKNRDVQRLRQITCNVACWHNDLFSVSRESRRGDPHNLVTALQKELNIPFATAALTTARYADAEVHAFMGIQSKLQVPEGTPALAKDLYLRGLRDLMRGNLDWSLESGRYTPSPEYDVFTNYGVQGVVPQSAPANTPLA